MKVFLPSRSRRAGSIYSRCMLLLLCVLLGLHPSTCSDNQVCTNEDSCTAADAAACLDNHEKCQFWANYGECKKNPSYMLSNCRKSCQVCASYDPETDRLQDFGVSQVLEDAQHRDAIRQVVTQTRAYMKERIQQEENIVECVNKHEHCAFWAAIGECSPEKSQSYMQQNCAPVCQLCHTIQVEARCPLDPNAVDAWYPGDLNKMFERIVQDYPQYQPTVWSRPLSDEEASQKTNEYPLDGPWVITLEDFLSQQEADRLIELGARRGYERSTDVGKRNADGTFDRDVNQGRTSTNAWCQQDCYRDPVTQQVLERMENLTQIPDHNQEYLQLLRYEPGQFYRQHHDYIPHQIERQQGVRILTVFLYLNEVEEGGGTNFPLLNNLTISPKRGRVLIWPSVLNEDPNQKDERTDHQALPVIKGIKYGANAWAHQRDFKGPNANGCQ